MTTEQFKALKQRVWHDPAYFIAFGFGSGLLPKIPGTWGSLAAIPLYFLIKTFGPFIYISFVGLLFILGTHVCNRVTEDLKVNDYSGIVIDEMVGMLITLFLVPQNAWAILAGFLLFRLFDIWKPLFIRTIDKTMHGGLGIMLDDVLAAIPAWIILQGLTRFV